MASAARIALCDPVIVTFLLQTSKGKEHKPPIVKIYQDKKLRKNKTLIKVMYLSVVPDMKSPLSDIFILAPVAYKVIVVTFSAQVNFHNVK